MNSVAKPAPQINSRFHASHNGTGQPRASIVDLLGLIQNSASSSLFPPQLLSLINEAAKGEQEQSLSEETYEKFMTEMSEFMLKRVASPITNGNHTTSEQVYTASLLGFYDALVWGFNSPFLWRISQETIQSLYTSNVRQNHCEIAVGTGLFLSDEALKSCKTLTLIDLNENSLKSCEDRIRQSHLKVDGKGCLNDVPVISKLVADINKPLGADSLLTHCRGKFQSVGANFLFHCLHGSIIHEKTQAFKNCASLVDPKNGVFFGSTILGKEILFDKGNAGPTAMKVLGKFNEWGVFGNLGDSFEDLEYVLNEVFHHVELNRIGYCGVWTAMNPK